MGTSLRLNDYENSFRVFKSLITTEYSIDAYPPTDAEGEDFGQEFPGALIRNPIYTDCRFKNSVFDSSDGAFTRLHGCYLYDCTMINCDFRYCDFEKTEFHQEDKPFIINGCNFSYGAFSGTTIENVTFSGCSFRQMQISETKFIDCSMRTSSIEQTTIKNTLFRNINFKAVGVRFCEFDNVAFDNVTFHILDLPKNIGLVEALENNSEHVKIEYGKKEIVSLEYSLKLLGQLIPYYFTTKQFYQLINVFIISGRQSEIFPMLHEAFLFHISNNDFPSLLDLCNLIVRLNVLSNDQLQKCFAVIQKNVHPEKLPYYLKKSYAMYIEDIKTKLVENPNNNPTAYILLKTNIESANDNEFPVLLRLIETNIENNAPNVISKIELSHNSPYEILIILTSTLQEILYLCQMFYYALGGMKALEELEHSRYEKISNLSTVKVEKNKPRKKSSIRKVELSIKNGFHFKYEKEYQEIVESLEYTIL
jgi:uncharacterized protein YjbI with pentapeptide repeats